MRQLLSIPASSDPNRFIDPQRLPAAAPRQRAGAEQHLAAEQQHGGDAALRHDQVHRRRHAVDRLRPGARSGFASSFVNALQTKKFPRVNHRHDYYARFGAHRPESIATGIRGAPTAHVSKLVGTAHLQGRRRLPHHRHRDAVVRRRRRATSGSTASTPRRIRAERHERHDTVRQRAGELLLGYPSRRSRQPEPRGACRARSTPSPTTSAATCRTTGA